MGGFSSKMRKSLASSGKDVSGVPWAGFLRSGLLFSLRPKWFLPFFIADLSMLIAIALLAGDGGMEALVSYAQNGLAAEYASVFLGMALVMLAWMVAGVAIGGMLVCKASDPRGKKCAETMLRSMPSLIAAAFITAILSFCVSLAPYVGSVLSAVVAIIFLFASQFIVLSGARFDRGLLGSARLLMNKPAGVIFSWLAMSVLSLLLIVIFASPMAAMLYYSFGGQMPGIVSAGMLTPQEELFFRIGVVVLVLGTSISKTFSVKFLTDVYSHLRKKKWIVF
jgi:hypothetical protein